MTNEHGHGPTDGHGPRDGQGPTDRQAQDPGDGQGPADDRQHIWDNPRNVKLLFNVFYALCAIVLVLDPVLDLVIDRHRGHFLENLLGFYPLYGFVGIVVLVLIAKLMRRALMRPEDYYDAPSRGASSRDANSRAASSGDASSRDG